uniref:DWNN domain-containing protein n=1 Tax=Steinernema glaseri TaxID=37863 RepID=A0A1I7Z6J4_9BILA
MPSVQYKYRSHEPKTHDFDRRFISVAELKKVIFENERLSEEWHDLLLSNAHTKRAYEDPSELIPPDSLVAVQRVPSEIAVRNAEIIARWTPLSALGVGGDIGEHDFTDSKYLWRAYGAATDPKIDDSALEQFFEEGFARKFELDYVSQPIKNLAKQMFMVHVSALKHHDTKPIKITGQEVVFIGGAFMDQLSDVCPMQSTIVVARTVTKFMDRTNRLEEGHRLKLIVVNIEEDVSDLEVDLKRHAEILTWGVAHLSDRFPEIPIAVIPPAMNLLEKEESKKYLGSIKDMKVNYAHVMQSDVTRRRRTEEVVVALWKEIAKLIE